MDYTTLIATKSTLGSIKNWINWDAAPAEVILTEAQAMIYSRLRVREMSKYKQDGTIALNASTCHLPADYIALKKWRRITPNAGKIYLLDEEYFMQKRQRDENGAMIAGTPMYAMIIGGEAAADPTTAYFDVKADQAYTWEMSYYGTPTALGPANTENFLTSRYSWLLRSACMYQAFLHKKELDLAAPFRKEMEEWYLQANIEKDMEAQARQFQPWAIGDGDG
jgi:hypothetical protein